MAQPDRLDTSTDTSTPAPKASTPDTTPLSPSPPSFGPQISDYAKQIAGVDTAAANEIEKNNKRASSIWDRVDALPKPQKPNLTRPEAPPAAHTPPNPIQSWGSVASVLATFGSLATRRPLMNALNSSAAAMNAIRANDAEAYQRELEQWKMNSEYAQKLNEYELKQYDILHEQYKDDKDTLLAHANALTVANQNTALAARIKTEGLAGLESHLKDMREWGLKMKEFGLQVERAADDHEAKVNNLETLYAKAVTSGDTVAQEKYLSAMKAKYAAKTNVTKGWDLYNGENGRQYSYNKETHELVHADGSPLEPGEDPGKITKAGVGPRGAQAMYMQKWLDAHPHATPEETAQAMADYGSIQRAVVAFGTGKQGDTVRSFETVSNHLDTLEQAAKALNNGDWTLFNKYANAIASATGQPAPTNFATAMQIVGGEVIKAVQGTPGGVTDREEARGAFDNVRSPEQLQGAIDTVRKLVGGQLQSMEHQYQDSTHRTDFRQKLHGKAIQLLQYVDQQDAAEQGGGSSAQPKKAKYSKGDVITVGGKKYKVLSDGDDPDVEEVK